jgi:hypothetical protein
MAMTLLLLLLLIPLCGVDAYLWSRRPLGTVQPPGFTATNVVFLKLWKVGGTTFAYSLERALRAPLPANASARSVQVRRLGANGTPVRHTVCCSADAKVHSLCDSCTAHEAHALFARDPPLPLIGQPATTPQASATVFVLMREPLARVVSHCFWDEHALPPPPDSVLSALMPPGMRYYRGPDKPLGYDRRARTRCSPTMLVSFAAEQHYLRYLSGGRGDLLVAKRTLEQAAVVGFLEQYEDFVARVAAYLGVSPAHFVWTHQYMAARSPAQPHFDAYNATVRAWVRHAAAADLELYDYAAQLPSIAEQRRAPQYNATLAAYRTAQQRARTLPQRSGAAYTRFDISD